MKQKNGITLTMLVVIVAGLIIISTATVNIISNSYTNSKLSVWITETQLIQDMVDENKDNISKYLLDDVVLDMSDLKSEERLRQADGEVIIDGKVRLKELNLVMLGIENSVYGSKKEETDTYAYSTLTGKVYYIKGMDARTNIYYTLTDELKNRYENVLNTSKLSLITFEQSEIAYTTEAVSVTIKVPKMYENVSITTSNPSINISDKVVEEDKYTYVVNSNGIKNDYKITITYTENGITKNMEHSVEPDPVCFGKGYTADTDTSDIVVTMVFEKDGTLYAYMNGLPFSKETIELSELTEEANRSRLGMVKSKYAYDNTFTAIKAEKKYYCETDGGALVFHWDGTFDKYENGEFSGSEETTTLIGFGIAFGRVFKAEKDGTELAVYDTKNNYVEVLRYKLVE